MITIIGNGKFGNLLHNRIKNSVIWNRQDTIESKYIIIAVPINSFEEVYRILYNVDKIFIIATKGMDKLGRYPSEIMHDICISPYAIFAGPNLSDELLYDNRYTYSILESDYMIDLTDIVLHNWKIILKPINGLEIINVFKNIIAILTGFLYKEGQNILSSIITIGILEMKRILIQENKVFDDLYIGDIIATATSHSSRNYQYGKSIMNHASFTGTAEGYNSLPGLKQRYGDSILIKAINMMPNLDGVLRLCFDYLK